MRVGYLVAPAPLRQQIQLIKRITDYHTPWPVQRALAAFVRSGQLERHIRRMRRHYAEKRALLRDTLAPVVALARLQGLDAGLHAYLELRADLDPHRIAAAARGLGVVVTTLDAYYFGQPDRNGLLLGYGGLSPREVERGAHILAQVIRETASAGNAK